MNDLKIIQENGKYGYADEQGNIVIPCVFKDAYRWKNEMGLVSFMGNDPFMYYINKKGEIICSDCYSEECACLIYESMQLAEQSKYVEALDTLKRIGICSEEDETVDQLCIKYCVEGHLYDELKMILTKVRKFRVPCNVYNNFLQMDVANIYRDGIGVEKDLIKALDWYQEVLNSNCVELHDEANKQILKIYDERPELRPEETSIDDFN